MQLTESPVSDAPNHPLAKWMAFIAFLNQNITLGCIFGSFSVLVVSVEKHLAVGAEQASFALPAVSIAFSVVGPFLGVLVGRVSIKLLMMIGSSLGIAGYLLLAFGNGYPAYIIANGFLLGPFMTFGVILSITLVTRWFNRNRGKAVGLISTPIILALVPLYSAYMVRTHGLQAAYLGLAALAGVSLIANFFVIDRPPGVEQTLVTDPHGLHVPPGTRILGMGEFLRLRRFWALTLGYSATGAGSYVYAAHTVPMAVSWGLTPAAGATLISASFFAGIIGTGVFGWIADRLGGVLTLGLLLIDQCVLTLALILHPSFPILIALFALYGAHNACLIPVVSLALTAAFGKENYGRAYGLASLVVLPVFVISVPLGAFIFTHTASYDGALLALGSLMGAGALTTFASARRPKKILAEI